jgi:glc operon protein GlcG
MRIPALIVIALGTALLAATALAQQPAAPPTAAAPPPAPDYGPPITNEQAKAVAAAGVAEAKKNNWRMAFAVVGPAGELVYFEKMDGTQLASAEISQGKARTAVMFRRPSKVFADQFAAGNTAFLTFPEKPIASEGGIPITVNGKIIGAIGASGGTGQQDGIAASAGANAAK